MNAAISVIIPTRNRGDVLGETLAGYSSQSIDPALFSVFVVDDGSDPPLAAGIDIRNFPFELRVMRQDPAGPARARNLALTLVESPLLLFTNDDTIPSRDFVASHLEFHERNPAEQIAALGRIEWSGDLIVNALMRYVSGIGGQQFGYHYIAGRKFVDYECFYTGNISLKRALLQRSGEMFSEAFSYPCYEDLELGYRLERFHELKIAYCPHILSFHKHPMDLRSFFRRQFEAGRMRAVFESLHPELPKAAVSCAQTQTSGEMPEAFAELECAIEKQIGFDLKDAERTALCCIRDGFYREVLDYAFQSGLACGAR